MVITIVEAAGEMFTGVDSCHNLSVKAVKKISTEVDIHHRTIFIHVEAIRANVY